MSSVTIAANYSNIITHAQHILDRAKAKYSAGAYLHWYWKYGARTVNTSVNFGFIFEKYQGLNYSLTIFYAYSHMHELTHRHKHKSLPVGSFIKMAILI